MGFVTQGRGTSFPVHVVGPGSRSEAVIVENEGVYNVDTTYGQVFLKVPESAAGNFTVVDSKGTFDINRCHVVLSDFRYPGGHTIGPVSVGGQTMNDTALEGKFDNYSFRYDKSTQLWYGKNIRSGSAEKTCSFVSVTEPGSNPIVDDQSSSNYVDVGDMRIVFMREGRAWQSGGAVITFPAPFAEPPVVTVTGETGSDIFAATGVTTNTTVVVSMFWANSTWYTGSSNVSIIAIGKKP